MPAHRSVQCRRWPEVVCHAVDSGWAQAPVDSPTAQQTQTWLATTPDPAAIARGGYWCRLQRQVPASEAWDEAHQHQLIAELARLTGVALA